MMKSYKAVAAHLRAVNKAHNKLVDKSINHSIDTEMELFLKTCEIQELKDKLRVAYKIGDLHSKKLVEFRAKIDELEDSCSVAADKLMERGHTITGLQAELEMAESSIEADTYYIEDLEKYCDGLEGKLFFWKVLAFSVGSLLVSSAIAWGVV